jgi:hypothetical protein
MESARNIPGQTRQSVPRPQRSLERPTKSCCATKLGQLAEDSTLL